MLDNREERLTCYDTVAGRTPTDVVASQAPSPLLKNVNLPSPDAPATPMVQQWELVAQTDRGPFVVTAYRPNYLLFASYQDRVNDDVYEDQFTNGDLGSLDIKFQLSLKAKVWPNLFGQRGDLWVAYTQLSFWQAYNDKLSSPFRETVHEPELIYAYRTGFNFAGLNNRLIILTLNHQSNGRSKPLSRSWNRLILGTMWDRGANKALGVKLWWRIPESNSDDDNPDIVERIGRGEIWGVLIRRQHTYAAMLRTNLQPNTPGGALQLDWSFPLSGAFKGYLQYYYGYGDGLIDYNHISSRLSLGIMVTDWM